MLPKLSTTLLPCFKYDTQKSKLPFTYSFFIKSNIIFFLIRHGIKIEIVNAMGVGMLLVQIFPGMYQGDIHSQNRIAFTAEV